VNPTLKRRYDSTLPFNDTIPTESDKIDDENFYYIFDIVFKRNATFAKKTPAPLIGDESTPMEQVYKFYKYWDNFESWREFSQFDEYDVREAADRYERRYMEKENKNIRDKHLKKEKARLIKLVDLAYKKDPRIVNANKMEELEKQKKKQEVRDRKAMARKVLEDKIAEVEALKIKEVEIKKVEDLNAKE
jgi:DnaJ family protein C protein 2